ncbi:kinase-like domain-containing protein, partial [Cerioporus squamosus]
GRVFRARVIDEPRELVAVQKCHVTNHIKHPRLLHEACALVLLQGHRTIPLVYAWGRSQYHKYLALQLFETDLNALMTKLTLCNLVAISHQILDGLEYIHSHGIVHCDIKPSNLMPVRSEEANSGCVRIIDFGICRPYRDATTSEHLPDKGAPRSIGTPDYMSLNSHLHHSPSRRDDIESLSYTILSLIAGRLPWDSSIRRRLSSRCLFALKKQWTGARLAGLDHLSEFASSSTTPVVWNTQTNPTTAAGKNASGDCQPRPCQKTPCMTHPMAAQ